MAPLAAIAFTFVICGAAVVGVLYGLRLLANSRRTWRVKVKRPGSYDRGNLSVGLVRPWRPWSFYVHAMCRPEDLTTAISNAEAAALQLSEAKAR